MTKRTLRRSSVILFALLASSLADCLYAADSTTADALGDRARVAIQGYRAAGRAPEKRAAVRAELLAVVEPLQAAGRDSLAALCLDHAGILTFHGGRIDEAQGFWARAVDLAESHGDPGLMVRCLNSRAVGFGAAGDYEQAIAMFGQQVPMRETLADVRGLGTVWGNLSSAYEATGRIPESIEAAENALRYHRESGNANGLSSVYGTLAQLLVSVDNMPQALAWADSAVAIARRHELPSTLGVALNNRADAEYFAGQYEEALASLDEALAVHMASGLAHYASWAAVDRGAALIRLNRAEEYLRALDADRESVDAYENAVLVDRVRTLEGIALAEVGRLAEAESLLSRTVAAHEENVRDQVDEAGAVALLASSGELYSALARCQLEQGHTERAWATVERGRSARYRGRSAGAEDVEPIALEDLQEVLAGSGAALIHFSEAGVGPGATFRITADGLQARVTHRGEATSGLVRVALDLMASGADDTACAATLQQLSDALVAHLVHGMPRGVQRLYVVAPAGLTGFPLEALPIENRDGITRPLGEEWAVTYLPSATSLHGLTGRSVSAEGMLALADPEPGDAATEDGAGLSSRFRHLQGTPLPYARDEVRRIAPAGSSVLVGDAATKGAATGALARSAAVLHFATHADVNPVRGERSSLILAGGDGILMAAEIEQLELQADLVTLSGCRTSGGYTVLGDGTFGLARAFLRAGTRSVVGSAWDVEDRAASRFMTLFYAELASGVARDEALRITRRRMAEEAFPPRDRYAFVMSGLGHLPVESLRAEPGAATGATPMALGLGLGVVVALAVSIVLTRRRATAGPH